ncbi:ATP-dependent helicase C-terminal domain-containing protein [Streptomyces sp. INA 01156]
MVSGTRAEAGGAPGCGGSLDRGRRRRPTGGAGHARVRLGAVVDEETARWAAGPLLETREEVHWADGDVVARRVERLGAVELAVRPRTDAEPALVRAALLDGLRREGFGLLRWPAEHPRCGSGWPSARPARRALARCVRRRAPRARGGVAGARAEPRPAPGRPGADRRLPGPRPAAAVGVRAGRPAGRTGPQRITVPSGSAIRIDYSDAGQPVLAVNSRRCSAPGDAAGGRVPLLVHLLSPAGRPAAVTSDLASFWKDGYKGVRAELRGRYPGIRGPRTRLPPNRPGTPTHGSGGDPAPMSRWRGRATPSRRRPRSVRP